MKVIPKIKPRSLITTEMRVITISEEAIAEVLLENLMENKSTYFDTKAVSENEICAMYWNKATNCLTYVILPYEYAQKGINFAYIQRKVGVTTNTLFQPHRYRRLKITSKCFIN